VEEKIGMISMIYKSRSDVTVTRRAGNGREEIDIPYPKAVVNYSRSLGDQKTEYYGMRWTSK